MKRTLTDEAHDKIAADALAEAEAQVAIIKALRPLNYESTEKVLYAVAHLCEAERLVPGVLAQFVKGAVVSNKTQKENSCK